MLNPANLLGYFSGLYFIRPDIDLSTLIRTVSLVHAVDAILCLLIASHNNRNRGLWAVGGLVLGVWALALLFIRTDKDENELE